MDTGIRVRLTARETEICRVLAQTGLENKELAKILFTNERTLKTHLHNIMMKTSATNRTQIALWWIRGRDARWDDPNYLDAGTITAI